MKYQQSVQEFKTKIGTVKFEHTYALHERVWLLEQVAIVINGTPWHCPQAWKCLPVPMLLDNVVSTLGEFIKDYGNGLTET
jgi:hypothetical protein